MKKILKILGVALLTVFSMSSCSSYKNVTVSQPAITVYRPSPALVQGDQIRYKMKDGHMGEMVVDVINNTYLIGQRGERLPFAQIAKLERKETSLGKTAAATGAGIGAGAVIVVTVLSIGLASALIAAG